MWKVYIDFKFESRECEKTRLLYERLAGLSGHVKVLKVYVELEVASIPMSQALREGDEDEVKEEEMVKGDMELARQVFQSAYIDFKSRKLK